MVPLTLAVGVLAARPRFFTVNEVLGMTLGGLAADRGVVTFLASDTGRGGGMLSVELDLSEPSKGDVLDMPVRFSDRFGFDFPLPFLDFDSNSNDMMELLFLSS